jgi:hypothetical protein
MMEAASTFETSVSFYRTTRRSIPEDSQLAFLYFRQIASLHCRKAWFCLRGKEHVSLVYFCWIFVYFIRIFSQFTERQLSLDHMNYSLIWFLLKHNLGNRQSDVKCSGLAIALSVHLSYIHPFIHRSFTNVCVELWLVSVPQNAKLIMSIWNWMRLSKTQLIKYLFSGRDTRNLYETVDLTCV